MSRRVAVIVFPGTNSEEETVRALSAVGLEPILVYPRTGRSALAGFDAYVLPGGFAHEDRIRAGAVAAHDPVMDAIIEAAQTGKFVIGLCNGAQMLLETGLVPGTGALRRPTAAFAPNSSGRFRSVLVHVKLAGDPARSPLTAGFEPDAVFPAWASHGEGRLAAPAQELDRIRRDAHVAFEYCDRNGRVSAAAVPNGSALACAGLMNRAGNVLALMPHPERIAWTFQQRDPAIIAAAHGAAMRALTPAGGIVFFRGLAHALAERSPRPQPQCTGGVR